MQPKISYIICGSPRSGNGLLCELLTSTGIAGQPEQYFGKEDGQKVWQEIWDAESENLHPQSTSAAPPTPGDSSPEPHRDHIYGVRAIHCALRNLDDIAHLYRRNPLTIEKYLAAFIEQRTMPNGVYGTQMMRSDFEHLTHLIERLPSYKKFSVSEAISIIFPNIHYLWLKRQNKVRQAVSFAKALQTKVWNITTYNAIKMKKKPIFSFLLIDLLVHKLEADDRAWNNYFKKNNIEPFIIIYEDIVAHGEETVRQIIEELGLVAEQITFGPRYFQQMADEISEEWVARYEDLKRHSFWHRLLSYLDKLVVSCLLTFQRLFP